MGLVSYFTPSQSGKHPQRAAEGRFDIIGDVHGQADALFALLRAAGWQIAQFDPAQYTPIEATHPEGRHLVFVGDLVNKGPASLTVLRLLLGTIQTGVASAIMGNHEALLLRAMRSPKQPTKKSARATRRALLAAPKDFRRAVVHALSQLPDQLHLPMPAGSALSGDGMLSIVHAGAHPKDIGCSGPKVRKRVVHGRGLKNRSAWVRAFDRGNRWIVHGHTPAKSPRVSRRVIGLDTGAGDGKTLTMLRADSASFLSQPVGLARAAGLNAPAARTRAA